jgi:hypothetical protein
MDHGCEMDVCCDKQSINVSAFVTGNMIYEKEILRRKQEWTIYILFVKLINMSCMIK